MKKFIIKLLLYVVPFCMVLSPFLYAAIRSKEILDFDKIIDAQNSSDSALLGMGYNEQTAYYKYRNANTFKVEVMALGTSRVMQLGETYFRLPFYNCGGAVSGNYDEYLNFLQELDEQALPQYVILGLDSWIFNNAYNNTQQCSEMQEIRKEKINQTAIIKSIINDYISHKWKLKEMLSDNGYYNIGFNGILKGNGFKKDGSYLYLDTYLHPERQRDYQFGDTFQRIDNGDRRFQYGEEIDPKTLQHLDTFLQFCQEHQIIIIGFIPPFAPSVLDRMDETGKYGYVDKIAPMVQDIFNNYGYEFYDLTDIRALGCDDSYFLDGFHGSEIAYAIMLQKMCDDGSVLKNIIDEEILDGIIKNRYSNLSFYDVMELQQEMKR